ncbi:MAG TPA: guanylate kinase [Opitutaceae bacterium]|nr:guanylate kinase [Opitutaceae bacterium]
MTAAATHPVLLLLAGPSGSGKTTLCERLVAEQPSVERVVTATTRPMRPGEANGVHYHFLSEAQFDAAIANGEFLEWACIFGKHRYGTLRRTVLEKLAAGVSLIAAIDVQGVRNVCAVAETDPVLRRALVTVFVAPATIDELRARLGGRGDDPADIERRMQTALEELRAADRFQHRIASSSRNADYAALLEIWRAACTRV